MSYKIDFMLSEINNLELFNIIEEGIMIVNKKHEIVFYNNSLAKIEGLEPDSIIGKNICEVFPENTYKQSTIMQTIKEEKSFRNILQTYITFLGKKVTTLNTTLPIYKDNNLIGAIEVARDVSRVKEMHEKVIDLQNDLLNNKKGIKPNNLSSKYTFNDIIGNSIKLKDAIETGKKASLTSSPVLIYGETGTGKELFAQSIHSNSNRSNKSFLAINCAAIPSELLEGILFGTVKGGFTGAIDRPGIFEQANGGTILLDEINSMSLLLQAKLLRVIQEKKVRRVAGTNEIDLDIKIISTTNCNLEEQMNKGNFRKDLFYRLNVVNISIPPLRERVEDIIPLSIYFLNYYNSLFDKNIISFSDEVIQLFTQYNWPGNIRELKHCIESSMNLVNDFDEILKIEHLPSSINNSKIVPKLTHNNEFNKLDTQLSKIEKNQIIQAIINSEGNISEAAKSLGIKRQTLQYKMKKHNISKNNFRYSYNNID